MRSTNHACVLDCGTPVPLLNVRSKAPADWRTPKPSELAHHSKNAKTPLIKVPSHLITVNHTQSNIFGTPSPSPSFIKLKINKSLSCMDLKIWFMSKKCEISTRKSHNNYHGNLPPSAFISNVLEQIQY
jgi:hypothetical protein